MSELEFNAFSFIAGIALTLLITYITEKGNEERERRSLLIGFITMNKILLKSCLENHIGKEVDYSALREEINENIISYFALSKEYKIILFSIYEYINFSGAQFRDAKININQQLEELYKKLEGDKIGVYKD